MLLLLTCKCFLFLFPWTLYLGFHHIRVHTPGATESATVGINLSCMMCSSPLKEDVKFRVLGGEMDVYMSDEMHFSNIKKKKNSSTDKQLVEFVHVKALDALKGQQQSSLRYQSVTLFLRGKSTSYDFTEFIDSYSQGYTNYCVLCLQWKFVWECNYLWWHEDNQVSIHCLEKVRVMQKVRKSAGLESVAWKLVLES